jgi:hypothetical protein
VAGAEPKTIPDLGLFHLFHDSPPRRSLNSSKSRHIIPAVKPA